MRLLLARPSPSPCTHWLVHTDDADIPSTSGTSVVSRDSQQGKLAHTVPPSNDLTRGSVRDGRRSPLAPHELRLPSSKPAGAIRRP